jgi:hypothetical protein
MYAFAQVAIYGKKYCDAAKDTWELIKTSGMGKQTNYFTFPPPSPHPLSIFLSTLILIYSFIFSAAIINDNLISGVLTMGAILGGASAAFVGALVAAAILNDYWVGIAFICFLVPLSPFTPPHYLLRLIPPPSPPLIPLTFA